MRWRACFLLGALTVASASCHRKFQPVSATPSAIVLTPSSGMQNDRLPEKGGNPLPIPNKRMVASFQRTPCYGRCPVFRAVWYSDGTVTYQGDAFVEKLGFFEARPGKSSVGLLIDEIEALGFYDLQDTYPPNGPFPTEFPNTIISLSKADLTRKVVHNHLAPANLRRVEARIEEWLARQRWVRLTEKTD